MVFLVPGEGVAATGIPGVSLALLAGWAARPWRLFKGEWLLDGAFVDLAPRVARHTVLNLPLPITP